MREFYPVIILGSVIVFASFLFILAYLKIRNDKEAIGFDRNVSDAVLIKRLIKYAKPYWKGFVLCFILMMLNSCYDILSPSLIGKIETLIQTDFQLTSLRRMILIYVCILLVSITASYFQSQILQRIGQKILTKLRMDVFEHIESLSHDQLNKTPVGKLVTRVANDTNAISMMFTMVLVNLLKNIVMIVGVFFAMLSINYELTLMVLCFVPFVVLFSFIFRKFSRKTHREVKDATTDLNTFLSENLSGIKVTQIFNQEDRKMSEFKEKSDILKNARRGQILVGGIFRPMVYVLYISTQLCLFYFGSKGYINDTHFMGQVITSGTIVSFYMYISRFYNPIQQLADQFNTLQSAFASAEKIFTIMDIEPEVVDEPDAMELDEIKGEIEFKDVWFAYEDENWVLKGVSFHVEPRQTVAFVGATGAGKTTILSLICRNYDIQKGQILIDGIDIKKIKISSLRKHFGQMLQDVFLFSGTIRSNIVLREESFTEDEILEACRYVNADHFINRLPRGLDEPVRERGSNFSAGQRQLLSFARTIIHRPEVMILDEATANIDTETELLIQDSLEKMKSVGTMIIVAHRLSTIQHADNIIVLSHGEILEQGNHQELLAQRGNYYQLYMLQYSKEQLMSSAQ